MRLRNAVRVVALLSLLAACSDSPDTVEYTVRVTAIEIVPKGGDEPLDVDGLPSASGSLVGPNRGPYPRQPP